MLTMVDYSANSQKDKLTKKKKGVFFFNRIIKDNGKVKLHQRNPYNNIYLLHSWLTNRPVTVRPVKKTY